MLSPLSEEVCGGVPAIEGPLRDEYVTLGESGEGPVSLFQDHIFPLHVEVQSEPVGWSSFLPPPGHPYNGHQICAIFTGNDSQ